MVSKAKAKYSIEKIYKTTIIVAMFSIAGS